MNTDSQKKRNSRAFFGVRAKLLMAFSIIAATTVAASTLGLYSLSNIEHSIRKITDDTVPGMTTAMMLSQKTGSLKSAMPLMAISSNEEDKNKQTRALQDQVKEIVELGMKVGGVSELEKVTSQLSEQLNIMSLLASDVIRNSEALAKDMSSVVVAHSAFNKQLLTEVDDLGFNLIIESEDATSMSLEALDQLINKSLVHLNAALNLQSTTNSLLLNYNVAASTQNSTVVSSALAKSKVLEEKINGYIKTIGEEYIDAEFNLLIEKLLATGLGESGIFSIKLDEFQGQVPVRSVDSLLSEATNSFEKMNESIVTVIDSVYFELVVSAETVKETSSTTIPLLMDPGVSNLRLLLEYRANNNMLLGLLSESAQTDLIEKLIPIRERFTAVESSVLESLSLLESLDRGAELITSVGTMLAFAKGDRDILANRERVLEAQLGFDAKMQEANTSLDLLLANVTKQVDAAKLSVSQASASNLQIIALSRTLLGAFAAASLIITVLLVWLLVSRNILQRLTKVVSALQNIADGNLFDKVEVEGNDELGELAQAVDVFREKALENNRLVEAQAKTVEERHLQEQERHQLEAERLQVQEQQNQLKLEQAERERVASDSLRNDTDALLEVVQAASQGDLTQSITVKGSHPTGQLGSGLDQLIGSFTKVMHQISSTANAVASDSDSIANRNTLLSERTQLQAASLEETSASMQRITEVVVNNSQNADKAESLVNTAHHKTQEVGRVVQDTVIAMNEINESSTKISEIVGVINEIAFQTNLLALNASVEAARAGQQGAGFAVVADEVRTLAARSATAAKEIGALIEDSVKKVDYGVKLVDSSGSTLDDLSSSVESVINIIQEIVKDSKTQSSGIHTVNEATRLLDEMTQKNSEMVDQSVSASDSLATQATKLKRQVGFFTIVNESTMEGRSKVA